MKQDEQNAEWLKQAQNAYNQDVLTLQSVKVADHGSFTIDFNNLLEAATPFQTISVCKGQPIPKGFVIVGQTMNISCPGGLDNAWLIKKPGDQETVCKCSPIPEKYVIIGQKMNPSCPGGLDNSWIIKLPGDQETVCKGSPIPENYVITGQKMNPSCPGGLDNAWIIRKV